jgi:saccharopine dehydrogenase-like NADP-dependent oxidoreductase
MASTGKDVALCKVEIEGIWEGSKRFECKIIDFFDENDNISNTVRMTAHPFSIVTQLLAEKRIATCGVVLPETCVLFKALRR